MNDAQNAMADFLRTIGYFEAPTGWTHKDHGGKCFTLKSAYDYELSQFNGEAGE